jgi:hypothetical protein
VRWRKVWSKSALNQCAWLQVERDRRSQCARFVPPTPVGSSNKFQLSPFTVSVATESAMNIYISNLCRKTRTALKSNMKFCLNWAKRLQRPMKCLPEFMEMLLWVERR